MDDEQCPECVDARMVIEESYADHIVQFRDFVGRTEEWFMRYNQTMAPMLLECLSTSGKPTTSDFQLLATLTRHAERFTHLAQVALSEYEEAYKVAEAIFEKSRMK